MTSKTVMDCLKIVFPIATSLLPALLFFNSGLAFAGGISIEYRHSQQHSKRDHVLVDTHSATARSHYHGTRNRTYHPVQNTWAWVLPGTQSYPLVSRTRFTNSPAQRYYREQERRSSQANSQAGIHSSRYALSSVSGYTASLRDDPCPAWQLLASGQPRLARSQFALETRHSPALALPQLGYSLTSALSGQSNHAVRAMRHTLRLDPYVLQDSSVEIYARPVVLELLPHYRRMSKRHARRADYSFMLAALNYIVSDYRATVQALERARYYGDRSRSLMNLQQLLGNSLRTHEK